MPYTSPLEDTKFILENLLPSHNDLDEDTIDAVLSEAGKLADNYLAPLNHFGDKMQECMLSIVIIDGQSLTVMVGL